MQAGTTLADFVDHVPSWVPEPAVHYLVHTEAGATIRALARRAGCHASTVLRQIRSFETRREDPLIDDALRRLGRQVAQPANPGFPIKETRMTKVFPERSDLEALSEEHLKSEARRVLRRMCESSALLVVAASMDKAAIVREVDGKEPTRTGIVDKPVAEAMALKGWIECRKMGRIARYTITRAGRESLNHLLADAENRAMGFADAQAPFQGQAAEEEGAEAHPDTRRSRKRYSVTETPLITLARRKDRDGEPFLSDELVCAGERLREDFELAQMGPRMTQNWDEFLIGGNHSGRSQGSGNVGASGAARQRVSGALRDLGPGLGDVALRCCCYLEGLERVEKRMGWSARSGKIVLRIALQRLKRHYQELGEASNMIG